VNRPWIITSSTKRDEDHGEPLFWSSKDGWTGLTNAERFSTDEKEILNLPESGVWVQLGKALAEFAPVGFKITIRDAMVKIHSVEGGLEIEVQRYDNGVVQIE
jgi:hypothetical protein